MWQPSQEEIEEQRKKVFANLPLTSLVRPCKINDGILHFEQHEIQQLSHKFNHSNLDIAHFIPASGSGSRMFQFIHEYQKTTNSVINGRMEYFINSLSEFAFFRQLPSKIKEDFETQNFEVEQICDTLLKPNELGFANKPKGLIPFHKVGPFILNPFQEHLIQGSRISNNRPSFFFTIQKEFEDEFRHVLRSTEELHGENFKISFDFQCVNSNSIAFDSEQNPVINGGGAILTRPSGHGALLPLLDKVNHEMIFIKNIDNVQHYSKKEVGENVQTMMGGLLMQFREEAKEIFEAPSLGDLFELNEKYQVFDRQEINKIKGADAIRTILNRPIRVCGMVRNEGQPGGGPFWIENDGIISKQIVEKAQIGIDHFQRNILLKSSHFNPVMIALAPHSFTGEKFNLNEFSDESAYFVVSKGENGTAIKYLERPGLWNGGMANWISIFVEIPSEAFTPVKTVLDLLDESHRD